MDLIPDLLGEWSEAVLLAESFDGTFEFIPSDGLFTSGELLDEPGFDFLHLLIGKVLPLLGGVVKDLVEGSLGDLWHDDWLVVLESKGRGGTSEESDHGEEFHGLVLFWVF